MAEAAGAAAHQVPRAPTFFLVLSFRQEGQRDNEWKVSYGFLASCSQLRTAQVEEGRKEGRREGGRRKELAIFISRSVPPTHTRAPTRLLSETSTAAAGATADGRGSGLTDFHCAA